MTYLEIAEELADFWWPLLKEQPWERWPDSLQEIHGQIYQDVATTTSYRRLSRLLIAELIDRAGAPPIESDVQAMIYMQSENPKHQALAQRQCPRDYRPFPGRRHPRRNPFDQRRAPRHRIAKKATIRPDPDGQKAQCQVENISRTGAWIRVVRPPRPGQALRLQLERRSASRRARVVRVGAGGCGIAFE